MLALSGIYQNGYVRFEKPVPIKKTMKVIVTFVDDELTQLHETLEKNTETQRKGLDLGKFSFMKSLEATKEFSCSLSEALIEERRTEE